MVALYNCSTASWSRPVSEERRMSVGNVYRNFHTVYIKQRLELWSVLTSEGLCGWPPHEPSLVHVISRCVRYIPRIWQPLPTVSLFWCADSVSQDILLTIWSILWNVIKIQCVLLVNGTFWHNSKVGGHVIIAGCCVLTRGLVTSLCPDQLGFSFKTKKLHWDNLYQKMKYYQTYSHVVFIIRCENIYGVIILKIKKYLGLPSSASCWWKTAPLSLSIYWT